MVKEFFKLWNDNFDKGVTIYQMFLMIFMVIGAVLEIRSLILFSMFNVLFGYFEPNQNRFSLGKVKK